MSTTDNNTTHWTLDPAHSSAEFKVKHMMIANVKGTFSGISGSLTLAADSIANSSVTAELDAATINTHNPDRDAHLRSADFFDVEKFPKLTFQSTAVREGGRADLAVTGALTIHGVTREVTFDVEGPTPPNKDPWGATRIGLSATARINRKDFGLTWNAALETGGILVGEDVILTLDVQFVQQQPQA